MKIFPFSRIVPSVCYEEYHGKIIARTSCNYFARQLFRWKRHVEVKEPCLPSVNCSLARPKCPLITGQCNSNKITLSLFLKMWARRYRQYQENFAQKRQLSFRHFSLAASNIKHPRSPSSSGHKASSWFSCT